MFPESEAIKAVEPRRSCFRVMATWKQTGGRGKGGGCRNGGVLRFLAKKGALTDKIHEIKLIKD